jgi:hypothetical protein
MCDQCFDIEKYKQSPSRQSITVMEVLSDARIVQAMTEAWPEVSGRCWGEMTDGSLKERSFFYLTTHFLSGGTIDNLSTTPAGCQYSRNRKRISIGPIVV